MKGLYTKIQIERARQEGIIQGFEDGFSSGFDEGFDGGYITGHTEVSKGG